MNDNLKKMHVEIDNLAVPEVQFDEKKEDEVEKPSGKMQIDYSGAIPQVHFVKENNE